ncbi:GAD-like domain-containing protein [Planktotalea arctica]|uniref:GAD-like domain-containing protein n=1 Tax=Planktotalea arctica TaxID=1481893 RepID=UPI00321A22FE
MSYCDYAPILQEVADLAAAQPMPEAEVQRYGDLVPDGLREVWRRHGADLIVGEGRIQFCDPSPMRVALAPWFEGDAGLSIERFVPFAYTSHGTILITDGSSTLHDLDLAFSKLTVIRGQDSRPLDQRLTFSIEVSMRYLKQSKHDVDHHAKAVRAFGPLHLGEVFGWEPPFQVTLDASHQIGKFTIADRIAQLQAIGPLEYHRAFRDEIEAAQYGGDSFIRCVGPEPLGG